MNQSRKDYIEKYRKDAVRATSGTGIFPSVMLAQAAVESSNGTSKLAFYANNHFGIKCHGSWTGKKTYADDDLPNECFRAYTNVEDSFKDYIKFLKDNPRYAKNGVFEAQTPQQQISRIAAAGYASATNYASVVGSVIKNYNLEEIDEESTELLAGIGGNLSFKKLVIRAVIIVVVLIILNGIWRS